MAIINGLIKSSSNMGAAVMTEDKVTIGKEWPIVVKFAEDNDMLTLKYWAAYGPQEDGRNLIFNPVRSDLKRWMTEDKRADIDCIIPLKPADGKLAQVVLRVESDNSIIEVSTEDLLADVIAEKIFKLFNMHDEKSAFILRGFLNYNRILIPDNELAMAAVEGVTLPAILRQLNIPEKKALSMEQQRLHTATLRNLPAYVNRVLNDEVSSFWKKYSVDEDEVGSARIEWVHPLDENPRDNAMRLARIVPGLRKLGY